MDDLVAYQKEVLGVGKWIRDSKVRYTWVLKVRGGVYFIVFLNSKSSHMARVEVNEKVIFSDKREKNSLFHFKLNIEDLSLVIKKSRKINDYELFVNGEEYEGLAAATSGNRPLQYTRINMQEMTLVKDFVVKQREDTFQLYRSLPSLMTSANSKREPESARKVPYNYMAQSTPQTKAKDLNDSGHIFKKDAYFVNIKDVNEDPCVVRLINNS